MLNLALEWAARLYLADAWEILEEDSQRALRPNLNYLTELRKVARHPKAASRLNVDDLGFEISLIAFWIMNKLDEDYGAALCTSSGNLLRSNHLIFFHPDQFFYFYLQFPLREMPELTTIYAEYDAKRLSDQDLWGRYCCIDAKTGEVKQKNHTLRHFDNYCGDGSKGSGQEAFDKFVKPFVGTYIVWDHDIFPANYFDLFESLSLSRVTWHRSDVETHEQIAPRKRGPKYSPAKKEFEVRYPDGLPSDLSAEAVAAELREAGFPVTRRTIQNYDRERRNGK